MTPLSLKKGASRKSAYDLHSPLGTTIETHTLAVVVDNEAGVLARVIGLFAGVGLENAALHPDLDGRDRVVVATRADT